MNYHYKKNINEKIKKINNNKLYYKIFDLIKDELYDNNKKKFTSNNNGIFFDINILKDDTLEQINSILDNNNIN
jgi:hypothetical protein